MYWRVSKLDVHDEKLPDGEFAPELYIRCSDMGNVFIKFDQYFSKLQWVVMQENLTYGHTEIKRFEHFTDAYNLLKELNKDGT